MKTGIVFEGGASRTLFTCGVMDSLMENNIHTDYIIGVSAGIAYGVDYASNQPGRSLTVATRYMHDKRYMGMRHMLNPRNRGYYNLDFVFEEIPNSLVPFDYESFKKYKGEVVAAVTNLETGKPEYFSVPRDDRAFRLLRASCALPIMFQPEKIDGKLYMDGGISDSIPFRRALHDGCDKIIVVLTREKSYCKTSEAGIGISRFLYRKYPEFSKALEKRAEQYNNSRRELFRLEKEGKAFVLTPDNTSGFKRTENSPEKLTEMYNTGHEKADENIQAIKEFFGISRKS